MTRIVFYEKPGCINNTRQKKVLRSRGYELDVRSLIETTWTRDTLGRFFPGQPEQSWFNPTAPALRDGRFDPEGLGRDQVLDAMIGDPLLVRRPLIEIDGNCLVGFEYQALRKYIDITAAEIDGDIETCPSGN